MKHVKLVALVAGLIVVLIVIILFVVCNPDFSKCGGGDHSPPLQSPSPKA
jgi:competence protein ComGC